MAASPAFDPAKELVEYQKFLPLVQARAKAIAAKSSDEPLSFLWFPPHLPRDIAASVCSWVPLKTILALRRVSNSMARYCAQLPLHIRIPRRFSMQQIHILCLLLPATRVVSFELVAKMNPQGWTNIFSALSNPTFDFRNIAHDGALDKAGRELFALGHYKQALEAFDRGLALSANDDILTHNRGVTLMEMGNFNDALLCFATALKQHPDDVRTRSRHALCLAKLGKLEEALAELNQLATDPPSLLRRADVHVKLNQKEAALTDYAEYLKLKPQDADALRSREALLRSMGREAEAATDEAAASAIHTVPATPGKP